MTAEKKEKVWDIGVRIFHWSLVATLFALYFMLNEESRRHVQAGYIVLGLIAFRSVWGLVGSKHARFSDFVRGPLTVINYLRSLVAGKPIKYLGHNPLGGIMVIALLLSVFITAWSGMELNGAEGRGPLANLNSSDSINNSSVISKLALTEAAYADEDEGVKDREGREGGERGDGERGEHYWERIHGTFAKLTLNLIYLHILGGFLMSFLYRENLMKAMVTGYKIKRED